MFTIGTLKSTSLMFFTLTLFLISVPACEGTNRPTTFPGLKIANTAQTPTATLTKPIDSPIFMSTPPQVQASPATLEPYPKPVYVAQVVKPGETLGRIAKQYGVSVETLVATNNIANPNRISVGQEILVPQPAGTVIPPVTGTVVSNPPASYEFIVPIEVRSGDGWAFSISRIDLLRAIDGVLQRYRPQNDIFLVMIGTISNFSGQNGCIYGEDFVLLAGTEQYGMPKEVLNAAKEIYGRDYPGYLFGQCIDYDKTVESYLVFDIPIDRNDLRLQIRDTDTLIGQISDLEN